MLLCTRPNETYATLNGEFGKIMYIEDGNRLAGKFGAIVDKIFPEKHLRKCNFIGEPHFGEKLSNGTYTGNLGLLQSKKAVLYLKMEPPLVYEDWINYNIPIYTEIYVADMEISNEVTNSQIYDLTNNLDFGFVFTVCFILSILIAYLIVIALEAALCKNEDKFLKNFKIILSKKSILSQWDTIDFSSNALGLFLVCFSFYIWFVTLNILNNIKTNKVVVDTSSLIKNEEDAFKTKRVCCFLEGGTEMTIAKTAPKENILRRLYEEKSWIEQPIKNLNNKKQGNRCIVEPIAENTNLDPKGLFIIMSELVLIAFSALLGSSRSGNIIWFPEKPIFEINSHFFMRNEKDIVERFYEMLLGYTEAGILMELRQSFWHHSEAFMMSNTFYRTLEEFMDDNSKFDALVVENFKFLFFAYFGFCLIILLIFIIHNLFVRSFDLIKFLYLVLNKRNED